MTSRIAADPHPALAELRQVSKRFTVPGPRHRRAQLQAVDHVDLTVHAGQTVGLVGESGSGKSTVARLLLRLTDLSDGQVLLDGTDITNTRGSRLRDLRHRMQLVFQDPYSSFDPLATIADSLTEALRAHHSLDNPARQQRATELCQQVGLAPTLLHRHPSELSGGQLQRAGIARALAVKPALIALDEPVSSLDVSTRAQVINLLRHLQRQLGVAYLFISHDLTVVRHVSHTIGVMYLGQIVESGPADIIYHAPKHPYTHALLSASPTLDPTRQYQRNRIILQGDIPSALNPPTGCRFHTRCPWAMPICAQTPPPPIHTIDGSTVTCHLHTTGPHLNGASITTLPQPLPIQTIQI